MVIIEFLGPIGRESINLDIGSLKELADFMKKDEELSIWIENAAIAVNDKIITEKDYKLRDGDRISILPPVCGG
jgi:molybdopterin synthase sulfur carrier subunit